MRCYRVDGGQGKQFYDGEFSPYPRDLGDLILRPGQVPEDICVKVVRGGQVGDMMFAGFNVVSQEFVDVLRGCQATGYEARHIRAIAAHKGNLPIPGYFLIKLVGRACMDEAASNLRLTPSGTKYDRLVVNESTWDGSDVFAVGHSGEYGIGMYVVERVAHALRKAKLRNVKIIANTDCVL